MNFLALDFETANQRPDSACQIGIAVVNNNRVVENKSWLIKPPYGGFNPYMVQVHGITANDVVNEPTFDELWEIIKPYFASTNLLIAHNAAFDTNVLFNTLKTFEIAVPELSVACTMALARRTWFKEKSYGLKPLSSKLGIEFMHHDAGEDAQACAQIAIECFAQRQLCNSDLTANNVDDIAQALGIFFGSIDEYGINNCKCRPLRNKSS